jgi:diguanylate cyclase (GGDEF)-like protein
MLRPRGNQHRSDRPHTRRSRVLVKRLRAWELWREPVLVPVYVIAVVLAWTAALLGGLLTTQPRLDHLLAFVLLVGCGAIAVEFTRRQGEPVGMLVMKDLLSAWWLPIAFVLPPMYSLLAPAPLMLLVQYRVRRYVVYRRVFSVAAIGLAHWLASAAFHSVSDSLSLDLLSGLDALAWAGLAIACAVLATVVNTALVAFGVKATTPEETLRALMFDKENLALDWGEVCIGVILAMLCALHPLLALVALTPVLLLQRGLLHDQLTAAARLDAKTALLNAPTWEREATSEIARAVRTHTSLSVLLLDIDHFKQVNDYFGHLVGDGVIRAVADVLRQQTREYDRCGRFGGDEFAVLLPQSDAVEAHRTAERIRRHVEGIAVPAGDRFVAVTLSVGVAQLMSEGQDVTDLLTAADVELYKAKASRPPAPTSAWDFERRAG